MNPISNFGRKVIIKGCLQSYDVSGNLEKLNLALVSVFAKLNVIVSVGESNKIMKL